MKRDPIQKQIDYIALYAGGPRKLGVFPSRDLVVASLRTGFSALERALQERIDEEGCGAFFAAHLYPPVDAFSVTRRDKVSPDTSSPVTSDLKGDMNGDLVTCKVPQKQIDRWHAGHSKSLDAAQQNLPDSAAIPPTHTSYLLK